MPPSDDLGDLSALFRRDQASVGLADIAPLARFLWGLYSGLISEGATAEDALRLTVATFQQMVLNATQQKPPS